MSDATLEISQQVRDMAEQLGVDVEELVKNIGARQQTPAPASAAGVGGAGVAVAGTAAPATGVTIAEGVTALPAETVEEKLTRENAVLQQEIQQVRKLAQTASEGRVVGSGGLSGPVQPDIPNLGGIEPGIRWAVRNGLMDVEKLAPAIADLFKADLGGVI